MRYQELLENTSLTIDDAHKLIQSKGQPWLKATNWFLPVSGRQGHDEDIYIGRYRTDRRSLSGEDQMQTLIDNKIKSMGGKALRSNSIFVTTDPETAAEFAFGIDEDGDRQESGGTYFILPLGDFNYHWYPEEADLVNFDGNSYVPITLEELVKHGFPEQYAKTIQDYANENNIDIDIIEDIFKIIYSLSQSYPPVSNGRLETNKMRSYLYKSYRLSLINNIDINVNKNLDAWMDSGNELILNSTDGYLAISIFPFLEYFWDKYDWNPDMEDIIEYYN